MRIEEMGFWEDRTTLAQISTRNRNAAAGKIQGVNLRGRIWEIVL
jgi:hypothetical protein